MPIIGITFITIVLFVKYKPTYKVTISGEEVGYIKNRHSLEEEVKTALIDTNEKHENIDTIVYNKPEYNLALINRKENLNEEEIAEEIKNDAEITYKFYEIDVSNEPVDSVNTLEDAQTLVKEVKEEKKDESENLDLSIVEKYTDNSDEVATNEVQIAKVNVTSKVTEQIIAEQKAKEEEERINSMPVIEGIRLAYIPVSGGRISSRFGEVSSLRRSTHTGLDIAIAQGTPIKVTSDGTVVSATYNNAYGNLVKVSHGNGIETWYAHTSKMFVKPGQQVKAGDIIAAVGSTGNSTGAHLHLEIRVNGKAINPQKYLYK